MADMTQPATMSDELWDAIKADFSGSAGEPCGPGNAYTDWKYRSMIYFRLNTEESKASGSYEGTKVKEAAYPEPTQEQFEKWAATLPTGSAALTTKTQVIYGALPNQPKSS
jgi:hypothetical protein